MSFYLEDGVAHGEINMIFKTQLERLQERLGYEMSDKIDICLDDLFKRIDAMVNTTKESDPSNTDLYLNNTSAMLSNYFQLKLKGMTKIRLNE